MTTIVSVRRGRQVCMGGDGQVSLGPTIMKPNAKKVRRLKKNSVLAGFAGCTADAFALFDLFEKKLELHQGLLLRSAVEFAKEWRTHRDLRRLEATLAVADLKTSLIVTGMGDVIQTDRDLIAIGSGGNYARAAAEALLDHTQLGAQAIVEQALKIASSICIYTNSWSTIETLELPEEGLTP